MTQRKNSRRKGAEGERELARWLSEWVGRDGTPVVASRMGRNGYSDADLKHTLDDWHIEVKRNEQMGVGMLALAEAFHQAVHDCNCTKRMPVVLWRRNRGRWRASWSINDVPSGVVDCLVTADAADWMRAQGYRRRRDAE